MTHRRARRDKIRWGSGKRISKCTGDLETLMEATGSQGNYEDKSNKIIKKIAKAVAIEKDNDAV